ncbi:MAG: cystathionine beta-lyase [Clostridiales bacterium]|nr:MAG: cystathionine beta-lyase [Clostridiales bacterium]
MKQLDIYNDREGTFSLKYEVAKEENLMPFWVADMDFPVSEAIHDSIKKRIEHPIFGYSVFPEEYYTAFISWQKNIHNVTIERDLLTSSHDVVQGLFFSLLLISKPGDNVIVQTPVYFPFFKVISSAKCNMINSPLIKTKNGYEIDFEDFENKISENKVKAFILCSPHNPIGRVWRRDELEKIVSICEKYNVTILSDEIHSDLAHSPNVHIPTHTVNSWAKENTFSFYSTGKTFNLAGLHSAYALCPTPEYADKFRNIKSEYFSSNPNLIGIFANIAAFKDSEDWYRETMKYIESNISYFVDFINKNTPKIKCKKPEFGFLIWLDCSELGETSEDIDRFFKKDAGLLLNKGSIFGKGGDRYMRWNVAVPRHRLEEGLKKLKDAYDKKF